MKRIDGYTLQMLMTSGQTPIDCANINGRRARRNRALQPRAQIVPPNGARVSSRLETLGRVALFACPDTSRFRALDFCLGLIWSLREFVEIRELATKWTNRRASLCIHDASMIRLCPGSCRSH